MTEQGPMPPDDRELEEFLARRSPLSRAYREEAEGENAPASLDAPVLAQARAPKEADLRRWRWLRWDGPLALAASTILVVSLAWLTQQQAPRPQAQDAVPATESAAAPTSPANAPAAAQVAAKEELRQQRDETSGAAARQNLPTARKPSPPARSKAGTIESIAPAPPPVLANAAPEASAGPAEPAPNQLREGQAPVPTAAPAEQPSSLASATTRASEAFPAAAAPVSANGAMSAPAARDPCAALQRAAGQRQAQPERGLDAASWLERIRRLRDGADVPAARAELACFGARHPQIAVPGDLRPLLEMPR